MDHWAGQCPHKGKLNPNQSSDPKTGPKVMSEDQEIQCQICDGTGHKASICPNSRTVEPAKVQLPHPQPLARGVRGEAAAETLQAIVKETMAGIFKKLSNPVQEN